MSDIKSIYCKSLIYLLYLILVSRYCLDELLNYLTDFHSLLNMCSTVPKIR